MTGDIDIEHAPLVTALAFPALLSGTSLELLDTGVRTIAVPALTSLMYLAIVDSPVPTCHAQALAVQSHATTVSISGTDDTASCAP